MKNLLLVLVTLISCNTENRLYRVPETEAQTEIVESDVEPDSIAVVDSPEDSEEILVEIDEPDIYIEHIASGPLDIRQSCETTGQFLIRNVGTADLIVNDLNAYATMPSNITITSPAPGVPFTLIPLEQKFIDFKIEQLDDISDTIMVVAKSNDPDEPVATKDATYTSVLGPVHSETFTITEDKKADILMIVDNSCSMSEEQSTLASNTELFINSLDASGIDYRIAVITTDRYAFVGPVIDPTMSDPALELSNQVNVGTAGSPYEQGLSMASKALNPPGMAAPGGIFLRPDARLSLIWISDEDDSSYGTTTMWTADFWSKKASPGDVSVWGIIGDPIYGCATAAAGNIYNDVIVAMGGNWNSICSSDWGTPLSGVAGSAGVDSTIELSGNPIPSTIRVFVNAVRSYDWVYVVSSNAVSFNPGHIPVPGTVVDVDYSETGDCN